MTTQIENLKETLNNIVAEHSNNNDNHYLDSCWIGVMYYGKDWRFAKRIGCKKDSYYGWLFYSTSSNSAGTKLADKMSDAIAGLEGFTIRQRYL